MFLIKILLISHFFPPTHNAGTENYTLGMAKALLARGHDVRVLCAEEWETGQDYWNGTTQEEYQGVLVIRIHLNWIMAKNPNRVLYDSEDMNKWISQFLQQELFDVVHIMSTYSLGAGIMESIKAAGIPLILTLMDFWFLCPKIQLLRGDGELCDGLTTAVQCENCLMFDSRVSRKITRLGISTDLQPYLWDLLSHWQIISKQRGFRGRLLNMRERKEVLKQAVELPDLVLTHSKIVKEIFARHTPRIIKILSNGHEFSQLQEFKEKTPSDNLRVGYVGQIISIKGVHILIEAFKQANLDNKARLEIWGGLEQDPAYVDHLKALIHEDPSISLQGRFKHDDLIKVLTNIDVLVVPSLWLENAPLVIQEAFASQTPVIATNLGGMAEMVSDEVNGLLFERGNVSDLARQLRRLVDEPELIRRLKLGIPRVKTVDEEVDQLEKIYRELIQTRLTNQGDLHKL